MTMLLRVAVIFGLTVAPAIAQSSERDTVLALLEKAAPGVRWDTNSEVKGDVNCDGRADLSYLGQDDKFFFVATITGPIDEKSPPSIVRLSKSGNSQDTLTETAPSLRSESMNYDTREEFGSNPDGFIQSMSCIGLVIPVGDADSFHFYWNHKANRLAWWRP